ncbi:AAA family ATPase [Edaphobacter aggregans]|uniref:AAA family ATPase n=1 Tax=Edaphobacter aggregans TaxID=570835 RepID=UPI000554E7E9|nr:ATP-binding protein [Edaphobacter aggregans]
MINSLSIDQFASILHENVSPTAPIQSQEHLFGREKQLQQVQQALYAPGRTVFIYGDRGVGKTSLAQTVAYAHQSSKHDPILLACDPDSTFVGTMASALEQINHPSAQGTITSIYAAKVGVKGFGLDVSKTLHQDAPPKAESMASLNDVVGALIKAAAERKNEDTVIVVDEFDRISNDVEKGQFADFIKQIGDQRIPMRFVFCGVAESLQTLLGAHASCYRYIENVELRTLNWDARFEIIDNVASAFNVTLEGRSRYRIAAISDGFPHYIHRLCEHLLWAMFRDEREVDHSTIDHFRIAVAQSVLGIEQHLKHTYDQAVMKDAHGYEHVLWAVADHSDLFRNTEAIYTSYCDLIKSFDGQAEILDRPTVVSRLSALKRRPSGNILMSPRKGFYQFRESIMRGYIRLRAEEQGCELALDYAAPSRPSTDLTWRIRPARRGNFGTVAGDRRKLEYPE